MSRIYVCSYGGSGSWLLVGALKKLGLDVYHSHSRKPPKRFCELKVREPKHNLQHKKEVNYQMPTITKYFDYGNEIPPGKIIFIHRNPIFSLLSLKSGNLLSFENLEVTTEQWHILEKLGFNYNSNIIHTEAIKKLLQLDTDPVDFKGFYNNYHNCTWNENYDILSVSFDNIWNDMEKICNFVGKKYNPYLLPSKWERQYDQEIVSLSNKMFPDNDQKLKIIKCQK
tara:strand:+ start:476 stop:1153 length:678 start_codon:yes stop_codon:yes gene_type:complete